MTDGIADLATPALPLHAVAPAGLAVLLEALPPAQAAYLRASGFAARAQELRLLPGGDGIAGAVLGLGADAEDAASPGPSVPRPSACRKAPPGGSKARRTRRRPPSAGCLAPIASPP